ncbi:MAG: pyridoxamine 5'-phosphate oxidase family protein [Oscillospiraceae bacterium]|nr:pyridoxamine 5'-phosphate oxidase family protein [Oscillospiraceae bacterium]
MFREMRRFKQALTKEKCEKILRKCTSGTLALSGDNGYPYAVPLSYFYDDGKIYFHCAKMGHKIDAVKNCSKASFCVIEHDGVIPEKFTTAYRSVIAFGQIRIIDNPEEMRRAITMLSDKYSPNMDSAHDKEIDEFFSRLCMLELTVEHLTGKAGLEAMNMQ